MSFHFIIKDDDLKFFNRENYVHFIDGFNKNIIQVKITR